MNDDIVMSDELIAAARRLEAAAMSYWELYNRQVKPDAVVWLKNNENGHLVIITRGEYSEQLMAAIPDK
jgi:hypothetical protein